MQTRLWAVFSVTVSSSTQCVEPVQSDIPVSVDLCGAVNIDHIEITNLWDTPRPTIVPFDSK